MVKSLKWVIYCKLPPSNSYLNISFTLCSYFINLYNTPSTYLYSSCNSTPWIPTLFSPTAFNSSPYIPTINSPDLTPPPPPVAPSPAALVVLNTRNFKAHIVKLVVFSLIPICFCIALSVYLIYVWPRKRLSKGSSGPLNTQDVNRVDDYVDPPHLSICLNEVYWHL